MEETVAATVASNGRFNHRQRRLHQPAQGAERHDLAVVLAAGVDGVSMFFTGVTQRGHHLEARRIIEPLLRWFGSVAQDAGYVREQPGDGRRERDRLFFTPGPKSGPEPP